MKSAEQESNICQKYMIQREQLSEQHWTCIEAELDLQSEVDSSLLIDDVRAAGIRRREITV